MNKSLIPSSSLSPTWFCFFFLQLSCWQIHSVSVSVISSLFWQYYEPSHPEELCTLQNPVCFGLRAIPLHRTTEYEIFLDKPKKLVSWHNRVTIDRTLDLICMHVRHKGLTEESTVSILMFWKVGLNQEILQEAHTVGTCGRTCKTSWAATRTQDRIPVSNRFLMSFNFHVKQRLRNGS